MRFAASPCCRERHPGGGVPVFFSRLRLGTRRVASQAELRASMNSSVLLRARRARRQDHPGDDVGAAKNTRTRASSIDASPVHYWPHAMRRVASDGECNATARPRAAGSIMEDWMRPTHPKGLSPTRQRRPTHKSRTAPVAIRFSYSFIVLLCGPPARCHVQDAMGQGADSIASTPVAATSAMVSRVIPPEASVERAHRFAAPPRAGWQAACCRAARYRRRRRGLVPAEPGCPPRFRSTLRASF